MFSRRHLGITLWLIVLLSITVTGHRTELAADEPKDGIGVWDGAMWRFSLTPIRGNRRPGPLRGRYRVENLELFQAETMDGNRKDMSRKVGTSRPGPGKKPEFTHVEFENLRAFTRDREAVVFKKLEGRLGKGEEKGQVAGRVISQDGLYWEFKAERVQE